MAIDRPGRPRSAPADYVRVQVRLPPTVLEWLDRAAAEDLTSREGWIRSLVERELVRRKVQPKGEPQPQGRKPPPD
jgi:hypothetical protein